MVAGGLPRRLVVSILLGALLPLFSACGGEAPAVSTAAAEEDLALEATAAAAGPATRAAIAATSTALRSSYIATTTAIGAEARSPVTTGATPLARIATPQGASAAAGTAAVASGPVGNPSATRLAVSTTATTPTSAAATATPSATSTSQSVTTTAVPTVPALHTPTQTPAQPTPSATVLPATSAAAVSSTPPPSPGQSSYARLVTAVSALDTTDADATLDYGSQGRTTMAVSLDSGRTDGAPRTHRVISYQGALAAQSVETITIGDQTWQRFAGAAWSASERSESATVQIRALLPPLPAADVQEAARDDGTVLRWYDADRNCDVEVTMAPTTGIPRRMQQRSRANGALLTVIYRNWNAPVQINAPVP